MAPDSNTSPSSPRTATRSQRRRAGYPVGSLWPVRFRTATSIVTVPFVHSARSIETVAVSCVSWRSVARGWRFDDLNELIRTHNEWYPVERNLPMDIHTRDYVLVNDRDYRRGELGPDWVLDHFPET